MMNIAEQFTSRPRNVWTRFRAALELVERGDLDSAQRILDGLSYHPRIDARLFDIYAGRLRRAGDGQALARKINTPADYLGHESRRLMPPFRRLKAGRSLPWPYPPHMVLPDLIGARNDPGFIDDATAALAPRGRVDTMRIHVIHAPATREDTGTILDLLNRQQFAGTLNVTVFAGPGATEGRRTLDAGGTCEKLALSVLDPDARTHAARIAESCDLVLFLNGFVALDEMAILRMACRTSVTDMLVQPLVEHAAGGDMASAFTKGAGDNLFTSRYPFRDTTGLNMAVPAPLLRRAGPPDNRFRDTFHAARELAFRLFNAGCYFAPMAAGKCLGIADPKDFPEDAELYRALCPNHWERKKDGRYENPKISIYLPAFNASRYIARAIDSVLEQDVQDLDVSIANDGSLDNTLEILESRYGNEPRVKWTDNPNGGIGFASNQAIRMSNSLYIGQLDSDDALKPGAVRRLMEYLDENPQVVCCYGSCERIDADGAFIDKEYSWPVFSREKMMITSITHHFRMFRRYAWERTSRFREDIVNAVDYDMFLKLCETGEFHHIDEVLYQRRWHGKNTSSVNEDQQTTNTYRVQREALKRQGLAALWDVHVPDPEDPRRVTYRLRDGVDMVLFWPDYSYSNPYQKLLYHKLRQGSEVLAGDIDAALEVLERGDGPARITFHLHWLNFLFRDAGSEAAARAAANAFASKLERFVDGGGQLAWTVHNTVSHDAEFRHVEAVLSSRIAELADVLHFHSAGSVSEAQQSFTFDPGKVRVSPHGNYIGCYPDFVDRAAARRALDIDARDDVLLFAGQLRPYKGVEQLLTVFRRILAERPRTLLVLAGAQSFDPLAAVAPALTPRERSRIRVADRFLDNAELQLFFHAADAAVFPYRHILTSGSMLLALSFGTPVIIPEVAMTREVLAGRDAGVLYAPEGGEQALETAVRGLLARKDAGDLNDMKSDARARADELDWPDLATVLKG